MIFSGASHKSKALLTTTSQKVIINKKKLKNKSEFNFEIISIFSADIISCVEFNQDGDLLATGDKGGRVVIFQRDPAVSYLSTFTFKRNIDS